MRIGRRPVPPVYDPHADPDGPDGGFDLAERATLSGALAVWRAEIARAVAAFLSLAG